MHKVIKIHSVSSVLMDGWVTFDFCFMMEGSFRALLRGRSTAAVNAGLTGSVDKASPWQRSVDVDNSQKTLMNTAT